MVKIDFREFLCVACDEGLPVVPLDGDESGRSRRGFSTSLRFGCPELVDASELTLKLSSARGELRGSDLGERRPGHNRMMVHEKGRCVKGFHTLGLVSHGQIDGGSGPETLHGVEAGLGWLQAGRRDGEQQQIGRDKTRLFATNDIVTGLPWRDGWSGKDEGCSPTRWVIGNWSDRGLTR